MPPERSPRNGDATLKVLEDAAFRQGLHPVRLRTVLLPVHEVEVRATTTTDRPYGLIDKFIERAIAETGAASVDGIAELLGLQPVLVDRAVRVLRGIGHLPPHRDALELTDLARASLRDGTCYEVRREDRRKIYFDGYRCEPLHRRHYSPPTALLNRAEAMALAERDRWLQFLPTAHQFHRDALVNLAHRTDRTEFNLPTTVENPLDVRPQYVFLRLHVVHAVASGGQVSRLAYGADTGGEFDEDLSELCTTDPDITSALRVSPPSVEDQRHTITGWLRKRNLSDVQPMQDPDGSWQVDLPADAFAPTGPRKESFVGSYLSLGNVAVRVWCRDADVRRRALVARTHQLLRRAHHRPEELAGLIAILGAQLEFPDLDVHRLRALVLEAGEQDLAEQLDQHRDRTPDTP
ncbi:hypothetical protein OOZ19_04215 [Saccharopolyspora sp. NFXS83]|nr:hypothetical protein [Saccharopolyspora sp. NFXS83]